MYIKLNQFKNVLIKMMTLDFMSIDLTINKKLNCQTKEYSGVSSIQLSAIQPSPSYNHNSHNEITCLHKWFPIYDHLYFTTSDRAISINKRLTEHLFHYFHQRTTDRASFSKEKGSWIFFNKFIGVQFSQSSVVLLVKGN